MLTDATTATITAAAAHTAASTGGHGMAITALILLATLTYAITRHISLRRYPFKNCPACRGTGRHPAPFARAHRTCTRCGGSGEQLRRSARKPQ